MKNVTTIRMSDRQAARIAELSKSTGHRPADLSFKRISTLAPNSNVTNSVTTKFGATGSEITLGVFSAKLDDPRGLVSETNSGVASSDPGSWSRLLSLGDGVKTSVAYDSRGQQSQSTATQWTSTAGGASLAARNFNWTYDLANNRTVESGTNSASYVPNSTNAYSNIAGISISYDNDGNTLNDGSNVYTYDAENRPLTITQGSTVVTIKYDYLGRRYEKITKVSGATTSDIKYVWNQWQLFVIASI